MKDEMKIEVINLVDDSDEEESTLQTNKKLNTPVKGTNNNYVSDSETGESSDATSSPAKRSRNTEKYLNKAIADIKKGQSLTNVASQYGISEDILYGKLISRTLPPATDILTSYEETCLVNWILKASRKNTLVFRSNLMERVGKLKKVLKITPVFAKSKFGRIWYNYFMKTHPEIYENEGLLLPSNRVLARTGSQDTINKKEDSGALAHEINILTPDEESDLVKWIIESNKNNSLVFKHQLIRKVGRMNKVMKKSTLFAKSKIVKLWYENFIKHHPEIYENDELILPCDKVSAQNTPQWPGEEDIKLAHEVFKTESTKRIGIKKGESGNDINKMMMFHGLKEAVVVLKDFRKEKNSLTTLIKKETDIDRIKKTDIKMEETSEDQDLKKVKLEPSVDIFDDSKCEKKPDYQRINKDQEMEGVKNESSYDPSKNYYQGIDKDKKIEEVKNESSIDPLKSSIKNEKASPLFKGKSKQHQISDNFKRRRYKNIKNKLRHVCEVCSRMCYSKAKLKLHMLAKHHPKELYSILCTHCSKTFASKYHLSVHLKSCHNGVKRYKCDKCTSPTYFVHQTSLYNHKRKVHERLEELNVFYCDICEKSFKYKNSLEAHIMYGHMKVEKKFNCPVCKKSFVKLSHMLRHKLSHTKAKPLCCVHCNKRFSRKYLLQEHLKTHTMRDSVRVECNKVSKEYVDEIILD